ncbi:MAG: outer membrane lipoprotein-sorting protein [Nitrospinae bacterium]|nr:outer membrane lipoprotein-sorting protein [Nitrospinota bacterium]
MLRFRLFSIGIFLLFLSGNINAEESEGEKLMKEVFKRHELAPYVFEKQTMVLTDSLGNRSVRKLRRYSRVESNGTIKYLLVIDEPAEVRGVSLLAVLNSKDKDESRLYLPAFGKKLKSSDDDTRGNYFLDSDFTIDDLTPEVMSDYMYEKADDVKMDKLKFFVVIAKPKNIGIEVATGYSYRKHYIRQDNLFLVRTDYYDRNKRYVKRRTSHDLKQVNGDMWRANMVLMEDLRKKNKSLFIIQRRIFSSDYVPNVLFTADWLKSGSHLMGADVRLFRKVAPQEESKEEKKVTEDN